MVAGANFPIASDMPVATQKRINAMLSLQAHKIIDKLKIDKNFISKEEALEQIVIEYDKLKNE